LPGTSTASAHTLTPIFNSPNFQRIALLHFNNIILAEQKARVDLDQEMLRTTFDNGTPEGIGWSGGWS
jgi:hypothetical protein